MSQQRFKPRRDRTGTTFAPPRANKQERDLRKMAALIHNQQQLDAIMLQVKPEIRQRGLDRMRPFLKFKAKESAPIDTPAV